MALAAEHQPLLAAAHGGDTGALQQLLKITQPDIRRYAQRHCLLSDVDDDVQEALLIVSRKLTSLRVLAAFSGWALRLVQRECRRMARVTLRYDPYDEERLEQWLVVRDEAQLRVELAHALESLPAHYREVMLLRDLEEMTIEEIAVRTQLTRANVKSRLHRARTLAREYLLPP
ncbi:sigma-70 family RNA polymerase sigma factor [Roseateles asaccharophilus]|uniref:RNA polymerase sigma factor (Sigma-70 family) n=1 Tax=Roseateles asaccharophilus TaxID=582607 RepID=A0ABU2A4T3_9BURK|nr:sigma-70 family RNA polymerase sigma factor [Roseateles asaccharophilus]MDR7331633.1 RNA polymerase sigma factor (sigma-70 family) [Roseateles asaccharophilus]